MTSTKHVQQQLFIFQIQILYVYLDFTTVITQFIYLT